MALKTYYDDLQVARGAAPEVIAAAYRSLSRKYHPDHNLGNMKSEQLMKAINGAYAVLSDPLKRKEYDDWIASEEARVSRASASRTNARSNPSNSSRKTRSAFKDAINDLLKKYPIQTHLRTFWAFYALIILLSGVWYAGAFDSAKKHDHEVVAQWASPQNTSIGEGRNPLLEEWNGAHPKDDMRVNETQPASEGAAPWEVYQQDDGKARPSDEEFLNDYLNHNPVIMADRNPLAKIAALNGSKWPEHAGYVQGYDRLNTQGRSRVTIDNSQNSSNAFVKLVDISNSRPHAVRSVFVPAYESFTIRSISPGIYDIRYKDLQDGGLSRSETFTLSETVEENAVRYDTMTITLYKVAHGNMETYPISEGDFSGI